MKSFYAGVLLYIYKSNTYTLTGDLTKEWATLDLKKVYFNYMYTALDLACITFPINDSTDHKNFENRRNAAILL